MTVTRMLTASTSDAEAACRRAGVEFVSLATRSNTCYASRRNTDGSHSAYVLVDYSRPGAPRVTVWTPTETSAAVVAQYLARQTFTYANEDQLQAGIAAALVAAEYVVDREVRLSSRDRIDLFVHRINLGIEVKVAGTAPGLLTQLARYAMHSHVEELLVVTTQSRHRMLPRFVGGKPCHVLHIGGVR